MFSFSVTLHRGRTGHLDRQTDMHTFSNITEDAGFDKGYEGCEHDGTYSSLCVDAPLIPKERVTVPPVKYVYLNKSSAEFNSILLMISVVIFGIWK